MSKKILILYTSVGLGHKTIAENIAKSLELGGNQVLLSDIRKVQSGRFERYVVGAHQFVNKHLPFVWSFLYSYGHFLILPFRTFIAGFNFKATKQLVDEFNPDIVITTQTTASAVVNYLKIKKLFTGLFGIAFSDFHLHRYWLYDKADFYLANIKEQKEEMESLGILANKIFVCGMSLPQKMEVDLNLVKNKFSVKPEEKVVLISSGSLGLGLNEKLIYSLAKKPNIKVIVVCGKNQEIFNRLTKKFSNSSVEVLGYYKPMAELYAIADIFVSKPGGLSVTEALQFNLPILIEHMLPGQEELNISYLRSKALVMPKSANIENSILNELNTGNFKKVLRTNPNLSQLLLGETTSLEAVSKLLHNGLTS